MKFNIFGYEIEIAFTINSNLPEMKVKRIINREIEIILEINPDRLRKIEMIKILRRPEVSAILIKAGKVPQGSIADASTDKPYLGLLFAKTWIETQYPETVVRRSN